MKSKANKKGMTLVEVIIAMSVFAIISTGFIMAAKYAYTAQVKAKKRLTHSNTQTTNLEDYRGVVDPSYGGTYDEEGITDLGVQRMGASTNRWTMTYDFGVGAKIVNDRVYGYYSTPDRDDKTYQLAYFSPCDVVALEPGEYWITINNISANVSDNLPLRVVCDSDYVLFTNEKGIFPARTSMPDKIIAGGGFKLSFGLKDLTYSYRDNGSVIEIYDPTDLSGTGGPIYTINPAAIDDSSHRIEIDYDVANPANHGFKVRSTS